MESCECESLLAPSRTGLMDCIDGQCNGGTDCPGVVVVALALALALAVAVAIAEEEEGLSCMVLWRMVPFTVCALTPVPPVGGVLAALRDACG